MKGIIGEISTSSSGCSFSSSGRFGNPHLFFMDNLGTFPLYIARLHGKHMNSVSFSDIYPVRHS